MASHIIDFVTLGGSFGTHEMREVWSEESRIAKHVAIEVALAKVQGELGVIPKAAADKIASVDASKIDIKEVAAGIAKLKHSFVSTVRALQNQCGEEGEYVHYGPTTQDIVDTGMVLQLKDSFAIVERDCKLIANILKKQAKRYQNTPMSGRTHGVQALPITFGFKLAVYLDEFVRHLQRLQAIKERVLTGNINGAVCTNAAMGEIGFEVERRTLAALGLNAPNIGWQSARDRISEYASVVALISGTLGKIGNEFYNLMRTEINEVEEPFNEGKVGSSTMPHKRNPALFEGLASLTAPILKDVSLIYGSMNMEHEREAISWRLEWLALPEINIYLSAQLQLAISLLPNIQVNADNMLKNLNLLNGLMLSERIMLELGHTVGKQTAHELVYDGAMKSHEQKRPFKDVLLENPRIKATITADKLDELLDPRKYLGGALQKVDEVIAYADKSGLL
ncbi:adenylosuccinate lyase [Deferribacterales bacterium RsTz2092]|nr:adenylosuccinate lyase [Deferribacterales bacterium]